MNTPERFSTITYTRTEPFTYREEVKTGVVTSFNYFFDRIDAVYVESGELVWLHQIH